MKLHFETGDNWARLHVAREASDPKYKSELYLWQQIEKQLNNSGFDLVLRNPQRDGHLTGAEYYLCVHNHTAESPHIYVYDEKYAIRMMYTDFNEGELTLDVAINVYDKQADCVERIVRLDKGE